MIKHNRKKLFEAFYIVLIIIIILIILFPILWAISFSFKPESEQFNIPSEFFSKKYTLENYEKALYPQFLRYILNSLIVSIATIVFSLILAILSSYSFSKLNFPGRRLILSIIIISQLFPLAAMIIPIYQVLRSLNLINTYPAFIISYLTFSVPVAVWLLKGFFDKIPKEIQEAATVDGCSKMGAFFKIVIPLSKPGIAAASVWILLATWQEFMFALTISTSPDMKTLMPGLYDFFGLYTISYGTLIAAAMAISIPVMILFIFLQKYFIEGLTAGAVKG